jgi:tRNA(Arg) A34 adenosine deaminase TadA
MEQALAVARAAAQKDEVPVGAVLVNAEGQVMATSGNRVEMDNDPTAHAEMVVIRQAAALIGAPRLDDLDLYVTLEPCAMCAAAISHARLRRVYYGAYDPKGGAVDHGPRFFQQPTCHHAPEVYGGMMEADCRTLLQDFFQKKRG